MESYGVLLVFMGLVISDNMVLSGTKLRVLTKRHWDFI